MAPTGPENFGELMRQLARFFTGQGPVNWEIARQVAAWAATGGAPEANPDPLSRARLEELIRVAEMHVSEATGLEVSPSGGLRVTALPPSQWALRTLDDWRPLLEKQAATLAGAAGGPSTLPAPDPGDPMAQLFGNLPQVLAPFLAGLQAGSMVGQLAGRAMGQYDLPVPRPPRDEVYLVAAAIDSFASEWDLPPDEVRMWICLREAANQAVLGRPHVRARLEELIGSFVEAAAPNLERIEEKLAGLDLSDLGGLQAALGDPAALLADMQTDEQRRLAGPLEGLLSVVVGYVDHVMDTVGRRLIGSYGPITEALRRRRLDDDGGARVLGQMFGVALGASHYETGAAFVRGVLERAGEEGLVRLWHSPREIPTPAEVAAPGLWLARLEIEDPPTPG